MNFDLFFLFLLIPLITSEDGIPPTDRGLNWYESLPAVAMDYKVHIDAGELKETIRLEVVVLI